MLNQRPYTLDNPALAEKAAALLDYAEAGGRDLGQLLELASTLWRLSHADKARILQTAMLHDVARTIVKSHAKKIQAADKKAPGSAD